MVEESSSKRITRGSVAKARASKEARSKHRNNPISRRTSSIKKRKVDEIASTSDESKRKDDGSDPNYTDEVEIEENEGVEYILKGTPIVTQHMQCYTNINVMDDLSKILTKTQLRRFRETTCFPHLIDMNRCNVQAQLFKCFMLFEVQGSSSDAFIIHVNGFTLRFTRRDFALISGLKCCDELSDFIFNTEEPNRLLRQYFGPKNKSITKQQLVASFNMKVWGDNDDDAVKFATLYFIHNFIMSEEPTSTTIDRKDFDLVESGRYVEYPWGNRAFEELTKNLHAKITLTGKYYRLHGFPLAMQIWLYECCSDVNRKVAVKVSDHIPRIRNWVTTNDRPRCDFLTNCLFRGTRKKVVLNNVTPTETELSSFRLPPEYIESDTINTRTPHADNTRPTHADSDDDFEDPPITRQNRGKEKMTPCASPARKKLRSSVTKSVQKSHDKRPVQRDAAVSPQARAHPVKKKKLKKNVNVAKKTHPGRPIEQEKANATTSMHSSSRTSEPMISRAEFEMFKLYIREEFQDLKKTIQDNFKVVLKAVKSNTSNEKDHTHEVAPNSPNIRMETDSHDQIHDSEMNLHGVTSTPKSQEADSERGHSRSPLLSNDLPCAQAHCIDVDSDEPENLRAEIPLKSPVIVDNEPSGEGDRVCEEPVNTEVVGSRMELPVIVDDQSHGKAKLVCKENDDTEALDDDGRTNQHGIDINLEPTVQDNFVAPENDNQEVSLSALIREVLDNIDSEDNADDFNLDDKHEPTNEDSTEVQHVTPSQFELPDELLPSLNPENINTERRIVIHPMAFINTPPLETVGTPVSARRARRPGPFNVSPYLATFESETASSSKQATIFGKKHPFNSISGTHDTSLYIHFWKWLRDGLLARHHNKKNNEDRYKKNKAALSVPLEFGVATISDKNWFYKLANEGQLIDDSHIDVIMYYLRKKSKYSKSNTYQFSTVDCNFSALIQGVWEAYTDLDEGACNASSERTIRSYICGFRMLATVPWHKVDNIFIPVNMKEKFHWVLIVICFNDRTIYVYDSIRYAAHDTSVDNEVNKFSQLIPTYLATSDFYKNKGLDLQEHPRYKLHSEYDLFDIVHVDNLPQQDEDSLDCGVYLLAFAEFLSDGNGIPETAIDSELMRNRYAALLWDYGMRKLQEDAISDNEAPPKESRMATDSDVERIVI